MNTEKITCSVKFIQTSRHIMAALLVKMHTVMDPYGSDMGLLSHVIPYLLHCALSGEVENNHFGQVTHVEWICFIINTECVFGVLAQASAHTSPNQAQHGRCWGVSIINSPPE